MKNQAKQDFKKMYAKLTAPKAEALGYQHGALATGPRHELMPTEETRRAYVRGYRQATN